MGSIVIFFYPMEAAISSAEYKRAAEAVLIALSKWKQTLTGSDFVPVNDNSFELKRAGSDDRTFLSFNAYEDSEEINLRFFAIIGVLRDWGDGVGLLRLNLGGVKNSGFYYSVKETENDLYVMIEAQSEDRSTDSDLIFWRIFNWWANPVFMFTNFLPRGILAIHSSFESESSTANDEGNQMAGAPPAAPPEVAPQPQSNVPSSANKSEVLAATVLERQRYTVSVIVGSLLVILAVLALFMFRRASLPASVSSKEPSHAHVAPSFNCSSAKTAAEKLICRDSDLAMAERRMASEYAAAMSRLTGNKQLKFRREHLRWFKNYVRACNGGEEERLRQCIKEHLEARTLQLRSVTNDSVR